MPSTVEHLSLADANLTLYQKLLDIGEVEWAMTLLFYAALHLGRAVCAAKNITVAAHEQFEHIMVRQIRCPGHIYKHYRDLKTESEACRYDCKKMTASEVQRMQNLRFSPFASWARGHAPVPTSTSS